MFIAKLVDTSNISFQPYEAAKDIKCACIFITKHYLKLLAVVSSLFFETNKDRIAWLVINCDIFQRHLFSTGGKI